MTDTNNDEYNVALIDFRVGGTLNPTIEGFAQHHQNEVH